MKQVLLFFLLSTSISISNAQVGSIYGQVKLENGNAVEGALVVLNPSKERAITDTGGNFKFTNISFGKYIVEISSIEIEVKKLEVDINNPAHKLTISVRAKASENLKEVNIHGKTEKRKIETSGFAVNVVDTKEASLRNLQTNELLNRTVGVRVRQVGGFGSNADYNLNGMSGRAIGIFIDGIEISTYGSSFNLNNIPPSMIERIEVYKGVLPAHLSGDYLGGGINVVLKKGMNRNTLTASVSYGSFNTQQADLSGSYRNAKSGLTFRGSGFYGYSDNDYQVWSKFVKNEMPNGTEVQAKGTRFNDAFKTYGARIETGFTNVQWADHFMLNYNGSHTYKEIQHGQYMSRPYMGRFSTSNANVVGVDFSKRDFILKGLKLNFNGVYSDKEEYIQDTVSYRYNWDGNVVIGNKGLPLRTLGGGQQGLPTMAEISRKITTLRAGLSYDVFSGQKIVLTHGFYWVDRQDFDPLRTVLEQAYENSSDMATNVSALTYEIDAFKNRLKTNFFSKYYQQRIDRIEPVSRVVNGVATRVENTYADNRGFIGYGFAASYAFSVNLTIITSAEKAVRMPGESEIFGSPTNNLVPNPTIKPETSDNFNLGFRTGLFQLGAHKISLSMSGFLRNTLDKIAIRSNDRDITVMPTSESINLPGTQSMGFEAELNYVYRHLNVMLNTSKFNTLIKDEASPYHQQQIPNEPFFTINGNAQYRFNSLFQKKSALNLYYSFGFVDPFRTTWPIMRDNYNQTPVQFIQDLGASYLFPNKKFVVSFDAKNILNREAYDNFASQKPGRSFYLKLNYIINNF